MHLDYTPGPSPTIGMLPGMAESPDLASYDAVMVMTSAGKDSVVALLFRGWFQQHPLGRHCGFLQVAGPFQGWQPCRQDP